MRVPILHFRDPRITRGKDEILNSGLHKIPDKKNALVAILLGVALICLFSVDAQAWGILYPGGDVKWDNAGKGGVRYPGGQVRWGQHGGGVSFPGGHVNWGKFGRGGMGINLPGIYFNVGW